MGGEGESSQSNTQSGATKRKESTPPDGYVCRLCSVPGHWIQVCPTKKTGDKKRKRKPSGHVPVPGKDPSPEDIAEAQKMQEIPPPKCFCGLTSRLNKVKRSKTGGDNSRALGKYFFFCSKKRDDETQCRFARPADLELNKMKARAGNKAAQKKAEQEQAAQKKKETKQIKKAKVEQIDQKKQTEAAAKEDSSSSSSSDDSSDSDSDSSSSDEE
jgi:hypothetical protein